MNIRKLSRLLKQSYRKTKSWNKTGSDFSISGGMAFRIAKSQYEPASETTRKKLGLDDRQCPICHRRISHKQNKPKKIKPSYIVEWDHLPTEERHKVIKEYLKWKEKNV